MARTYIKVFSGPYLMNKNIGSFTFTKMLFYYANPLKEFCHNLLDG